MAEINNEVFSESLAYPQVKQRAVSSRSFRTKIPASNGATFANGQTVNIDLPGNMSGQYYNMNQLYLKFTFTPSADVILDRNGCYNLIKRLVIQTAGSQLCDINNYNVIICAMLDMQATHEWKASSGNILAGMTGDSLRGITVVANTGRVFCIPIVLNVLANTTPHRLIPAFSLANLQIRLELENPATAYVCAAASTYTITEVELVCLMTQLSPGAQSLIDSATNGQYNILAVNYMNAQSSQAAGQSTLTANLGFSMSSLERIVVIHRKATGIAETATYSTSRVKNGLTEFSFLINSEQYPSRPILVTGAGAEAWAEVLIADHKLTDFTQGSTINVGTAVTNANSALSSDLGGVAPQTSKRPTYTLSNAACTGLSPGFGYDGTTPSSASSIGTFVAACEFESGLSDGKSSHIYSGISTIASTVQFKGAYTGAEVVAAQLDFFASYTVLLSLDMKGMGIWQMRV